MSRHNYHGAEYVPDHDNHTDREQEAWADIQVTEECVKADMITETETEKEYPGYAMYMKDRGKLPEGYRRVLDESTDYMKIEKIPIPEDTYNSLEEILQDINNAKMFPYHLLKNVRSIKEKLRASIDAQKYITDGTK